MKIMNYEYIKVIIHVLSLAKMIIKMVVHHHGVLESIIMDWDLLFISKF